MELYKQCTLERITSTGRLVEVAYIPEHLAVIGRNIEIKLDGDWAGYNWTVTKVSNRTADGKYIMRRAHQEWGPSLDKQRGKV